MLENAFIKLTFQDSQDKMKLNLCKIVKGDDCLTYL